MGFEFFKSKPKTPEQKKTDNSERIALGIAAAGAAALGGVAAEVAQEPSIPNQTVPASVEAPVQAENPTIGMKSTGAPPVVVIPAPKEMAGPAAIVTPEGPGTPVVVNLDEHQQIVQEPEH